MKSRFSQWCRFLVGLAGITGFLFVIGSCWSPPGAVGTVLRHNQANDIDASPLFYSEVEHMTELERGLAQMRDSASTWVRPDSLLTD